jgi:energy-converting hydrogenase Eha subunit B
MRQLWAGLVSRRTLTWAVLPCWLGGAACLVVMASRGASTALVIAWLSATAASVVVTWRADLPPPRPHAGGRAERIRLDGECRPLLRRAQAAISAVLDSPDAAAAGLLPADGAVILRRHEQEIAATLREITALRAGLDPGPPAARGPMTEAVITSQQRALALAAEAITARVCALERLAAQVQAAGAARLDWQDAHRLAGRNDRYLDLLARTTADDHAMAEITGLTAQAARAGQALRDSLAALADDPEVLAVPGPAGSRAEEEG